MKHCTISNCNTMSRLAIALFTLIVASAVHCYILPDDEKVARESRLLTDLSPLSFWGNKWNSSAFNFGDKFKSNNTFGFGNFSVLSGIKNSTNNFLIKAIDNKQKKVSDIVDRFGEFHKSKIEIIKMIAKKPGNHLKWLALALNNATAEHNKNRKEIYNLFTKPFKNLFKRN